MFLFLPPFTFQMIKHHVQERGPHGSGSKTSISWKPPPRAPLLSGPCLRGVAATVPAEKARGPAVGAPRVADTGPPAERVGKLLELERGAEKGPWLVLALRQLWQVRVGEEEAGRPPAPAQV